MGDVRDGGEVGRAWLGAEVHIRCMPIPVSLGRSYVALDQERRWALAWALAWHVRGGSEVGCAWHEADTRTGKARLRY